MNSPQAVTQVGQVHVSKESTGTMHAFFVHGGTTTYIMKDGSKVLFRAGAVPKIAKPAFVTDIEGYILELQEQIKLRHTEIHTEPGYETVEKDDLDPMADVKKQAVQEYLESKEYQDMLRNIKGVGTPANSESEVPKKFTGQNSDQVAKLAGESTSPVIAPAPITLGKL